MQQCSMTQSSMKVAVGHVADIDWRIVISIAGAAYDNLVSRAMGIIGQSRPFDRCTIPEISLAPAR
jgi:hypothetical protein